MSNGKHVAKGGVSIFAKLQLLNHKVCADQSSGKGGKKELQINIASWQECTRPSRLTRPLQLSTQLHVRDASKTAPRTLIR